MEAQVPGRPSWHCIEPVSDESSLALFGKPRVLYVTYTTPARDDARNKVERLRGRIPDGLQIETFDAIAESLALAASERCMK